MPLVSRSAWHCSTDSWPSGRKRSRAVRRLGRRGSAARAARASTQLSDAELQQLSVDSRRPPKRIGLRHGADQLADVVRYGRSAGAPPTLPRPNEPKELPVPTDDGFRFDDDNSVSPFRPNPREHDPEQSVRPAQRQSRRPRPLKGLAAAWAGGSRVLKHGRIRTLSRLRSPINWRGRREWFSNETSRTTEDSSRARNGQS